MAIFDEINKKFLCECGCGEEVSDFLSTYKRGHNTRLDWENYTEEQREVRISTMYVPNLVGLRPPSWCLAISEGKRREWNSLTEWERFLRSVKNSESHLGQVQGEESRKKRSVSMKGKVRTRENCENLSRAKKKAYQDPDFKAKMVSSALRGNRSRPNRLEKELGNLLDIFWPDDWKYVGNGGVIINGKCPDFINVNGKKLIIELFGEYWHLGDNESDRASYFSPFGYRTLVIWESELGSIEVLDKISNFIKGY